MKTRILILAALLAAFAHAESPAATPVPPVPKVEVVDPKDAEIKRLKEEGDYVKKVMNDYIQQVEKLKNQRNQLAAGLLDMQQAIQDLQQALAQAKAQPVTVQDNPKVEVKK